ncbi:MAG: Calx-beta domain-containing protein [Gammaproteobacteria bacterium]|nr:Calx-beta domain-containing protein [Gammaproteobacteria bacterium]
MPTLAVAVATLLAGFSPAVGATSLQFFGNGVNDIDRVKIRIDNPADNNPGPPADIGATDFTIEFWIRPDAGNTSTAVVCGQGNGWINGNIVFDRDRFLQPRGFGISLSGGQVTFGVDNDFGESLTICGTSDLRDGNWHHVAAQWRLSDGRMQLFIDGVLEAEELNGPEGDISYPDDGVPGDFCGGPCVNSDPFIVIAAEKHDAGPQFPSYSGHFDELRLSTTLRYSQPFTPPTSAFVDDAQTAALYHFDEGSGGDGTIITDFATAPGGPSNGVLRFGGNPAGPVWSMDEPFAAAATGTLQFTAAAYSVAEDGWVATITVSRVGGSAGAATIDYATAAGTATAGSDYTETTGTLNWADGDSANKSFDITIFDNDVVESSETVNVSLSNPTGASAGAIVDAVLTITDDDTGGGSGANSGGSSSLDLAHLLLLFGLLVLRRSPLQQSVRGIM